MKKVASLLLLPLLLAACGSQTAPQAFHTYNGSPVASTGDYYTNFEVQVQRDLAALGLTGDLSGQALTPKSYLNVLKVSDTTARAYFKTTYPSATGCTLDWGDNSSGAVTTPTPSTMSSDQQTHVYSASGTYTIKLTCGTDVKMSSFKATVALNGFFDGYSGGFSPWGGGEETYVGGSYDEKGFRFTAAPLFMERNGWGLPQGHQGLAITCSNANAFQAISGASFNITSISAGSLYGNSTQITAYDSANQIIATTTFTNNSSAKVPIETRNLGWNNVSKIVCSGYDYLLLDDMVATINTSL